MIDQYSAERIADRMAIQDVMYKWCRAIDRLDPDGMRAVFHPDAIDEHGPYNGGVEGLVAWIMARHQTIPFSSHQVSNMLIEFATPDLALAETYVRTLQRYPGEAGAALSQMLGAGAALEPGVGGDLMTSSRYVDRFERRNGTWKIAGRKLSQDWKQLFLVTATTPKNNPAWVSGRRDGSDILFQERRALGLGK
jgi:hypothetical protein